MVTKPYGRSYSEHKSEMTLLSDENEKLARDSSAQSREAVQSVSVDGPITLVSSSETLNAQNWADRLKVANSELQRVTAVFGGAKNYEPSQASERLNNPTIHKTYRTISSLGAANKTFVYAIEWLERLRAAALNEQMWWREPLINLGVDSEIVFEWWYENKKITVYILDNTAEYIKVWGHDIDNEMEDGSATSRDEILNLWKWLVL
ncbi:hypothetical protein F7734_34170 [Scytonema sp. UIC 10036]|uniref:hypothetical protein n=1 Tax=Scytonema sp. UIC 10036 TaxID=2304196 RepID=UPI0012DA0288|nr:hypothetical protein [Scytonema sp. UIC 10036]MUG97108.1 hypothetical protein [Scytonema sp. UIC 10036]